MYTHIYKYCIYVCKYVCVRMCICMSVYMCTNMYTPTYTRTYISLYICVRVWLNAVNMFTSVSVILRSACEIGCGGIWLMQSMCVIRAYVVRVCACVFVFVLRVFLLLMSPYRLGTLPTNGSCDLLAFAPLHVWLSENSRCGQRWK